MAATSSRRARIASYSSRAAAIEGSSVVAKAMSRSAGQTRCSVGQHARQVNSTFPLTLECVRARVWLLPSLRSVGACVWPWLPERVVVVHMPCVLKITYLLTYYLLIKLRVPGC
jgi:hypothetical protein